MIAARGNAAPLRFVLVVVGMWITARGVMVAGWRPSSAADSTQPGSGWLAALHPFGSPAEATAPLVFVPSRHRASFLPLVTRPLPIAAVSQTLESPVLKQRERKSVLLTVATPAQGSTYRANTGAGEAAMATERAADATSRWSGSAWAFVRGGRATALSPGGQIGGGQAGARLLYRVESGFSASARLSHTIGGARQSEASIGIDWKPLPHVPIHILAERRVAIDKGGRDAWTLGAAGGVYALPLGGHWRLDAYAEAGVVGAKRRDLYADGAARIARAIDLGDGRSLALGGGAWGAAQPGASRIDIGPSAVLRLPIEGHTVAVALDWRQRVTGDAKPGSGVALTIGIDF